MFIKVAGGGDTPTTGLLHISILLCRETPIENHRPGELLQLLLRLFYNRNS